ncbi:MAG: BamA/TamA family outer membrane protein [Magnetococcales bacterium]|nr:BamA/TamA family outer membrane protein [Magnetococcales bacterium]
MALFKPFRLKPFFRSLLMMGVGLFLLVGQESHAEDETIPDDDPPSQSEEAPQSKASPLEYEVEILGAPDNELTSLLESASDAIKRQDRPPETHIVLERRLEGDETNLVRAMYSRGYLDAQVKGSMRADVDPIVLTFQVEAGTRYRFGDIQINITPGENAPEPPKPHELELNFGEPAVARTVLDAQSKLTSLIQKMGYPFVKPIPYLAYADRDKKLLNVVVGADPGPLVHLGAARLKGYGETNPDFLMTLIPWQPGEKYHPDILEKARQAMVGTGLFAMARVHLLKEPDPEKHLPVEIELKEKKHRTISSGMQFSTDKGVGGTLGWEHRNFNRSGEVVSLEGEAAVDGFGFTGSFGKPHFLRMDQKLIAAIDFNDEETEAFERTSLEASMGVERTFSPRLQISLGLSYRVVTILEGGELDDDSFGLVSLPARVLMDHSNDLLDPTSGWRLEISGGPYLETLENGVLFGKFQASHSRYIPIMKSPQIILATRLAGGFLSGAGREQLPADERFYVGGGGSLRGFGFQLAGPLDDELDPLGGASMLELNNEFRIGITDSIGMVLFVDAGRAYEDEIPDLTEELFIGAGAGVRYKTPIGPLRLDVGFPVNSREDVDDVVQFYVSLGQAF